MTCEKIRQNFEKTVTAVKSGGPITEEHRTASKEWFDHIPVCPTCKAEVDEIMKDYDDDAFDAFITNMLHGQEPPPPEGTPAKTPKARDAHLSGTNLGDGIL
ncbi:MAG: hypothetical protein Q7S16_00750 [bacterium]|nr:hypothetical protein [bacterium]